MVNVPVNIKGDRISLRKFSMGDAGDVYENCKSRAVARWTLVLPHPYPKDGAAKFIRRSQRLWRNGKAYHYAIILNDRQKNIGSISMNRVDQNHKNGELGYLLNKKYWGNGYATEAVKLMLDIGFGKLQLHRIYAHTFDENIASGKVLEKCGFKYEGEWREAIFKYKKYHNFTHYGILKSEYRAK